MKKKKWKIVGGFFLIILIFTIISRKLNDMSKAVVEVENVSSGNLDYSIQAQGTVKNSDSVTVSTLENQLIENISVKENQRVKQGEELFSVNLEQLNAQIQEAKREVESLKFQIADARSTRQTEESAHNNSLAQAQKNYNATIYKYDEEIASIQAQIQEESQLPEKERDNGKIEELNDEYERLLEQKETDVQSSEEALSQASVPLASSSEPERLTLELEEKEEELNKLEELSQAEGKIYAPFEGIVTKITGETGTVTSGDSVLLMAEISSGNLATIQLTEEQKNNLNEGDTGRIEGYDENNSEKILEEAKIISIQKNTETENYEAIVDLQEQNFLYGSNVDFYIEKSSQPYSCCIPISALRVDSSNNYYVLVVEEQETILGNEFIAKQINVDIVKKNGTIAAIKDGMLDSSQKIIINASKIIEKGSTVKLKESNHDE